ncbi:MAG TPA: rhodanese-like domain-containing protein [Gammaproteobacteria bacterium]|nr:rhodanese-like domain-containing protein [Gammaproteobacteria bacterium]
MFAGNVKAINAPELDQWRRDEADPCHIIDVREMLEIAQGTIPGAKPIPLATLLARMDELDRERRLVIICRSGARSAQACRFLQQQGYDNVYNLRGGMIGWAHESLPIERL